MMGPIFLNLNRRLRRWLVLLWHLEGSPGQRSRGLAIGVFSGCFPLFGLQTVIGVALASLFKGNHLLAVSGTWISNPFTYLPIYWLNYKIGCVFIGSARDWSEFTLLALNNWSKLGLDFVSRLFLGSFLVGIILGSLAGFSTYLFLRQRMRSGINKLN